MALLAQGTKIQIQAPGSADYTDVACIQNYGLELGERNTIDTTCLDSSTREFKFGLPGEGTFNLELQYDPQSEGIKQLEESYASSEPYKFKIVYTDTTEKDFDGYVVSFSDNGEIDNVYTASASIQITGGITTTPPTPKKKSK